jgi:hypothetical protein
VASGEPGPPCEPVHEPWDFCARCFTEVWDDPLKPRRSRTIVNLYPFATELRKWMQQKPARLLIITPESLTLTNPFSQHASYLATIFAEVVNDFVTFAKGRDPSLAEPWRVDVKRMRLATEMILYALRLCEALLKQLLYCTQFEFGRYWYAPMERLLVARCRACKGRKTHTVSLAGSLAHRYKLCGQYEQCLRKDLGYLNRLRNSQAAHATVGPTNASGTLEEAWQAADWYCFEVGEKFVHMLSHISEIEQAAIKELSERSLTESPFGQYNSNLVSTYRWQLELVKLYQLLRWRGSTLAGG